MRLLDDKIAVVPHDPFGGKKDSDSQIHIPDDIRERMEAESGVKYVYGKVVVTGEGKRLDNGTVRPMGVSEGDVVYHYAKAGFEMKDADGREVRVLTEADVIAVL